MALVLSLIQTATENPGFNLSSLNGLNGFALNGATAYGYLGYSVSSAGDINGDDIDDIIVGAYNVRDGAGQSYVVYGSEAGFSASLNLAILDGTHGFTIDGILAQDFSGYSVSSAGDVNGDRIDDIVIGAYGADPDGKNGAGQSYVVYGRKAGFPAVLNLSTLDGTNGFIINGIAANDFSGYSVSGAGDINYDGIDDIIIGAYNARGGAGQSYVVFGRTAQSATFNLSILDGTNGFIMNGIAPYDGSGISVNRAGDVNGDGINDLIIGASGADPNDQNLAGQSYVVFGSRVGLPALLDLSTLDGTNGFVVNGVTINGKLGISVSEAGDLNADGMDDLVIGAPGIDAFGGETNGNTGAGQSYILYGSNANWPATFDLSTLNGMNGFTIHGVAANDRLGISVSGVGDVNGDGVDDLLIGAYGADSNGNSDAGQSYVIFGSQVGLPAVLNPSTLEGTNGIIINGIATQDSSGISVSGAGDVNRDGVHDLLIGAYSASPNASSLAGQSYVVFGRKMSFSTTVIGKMKDSKFLSLNSNRWASYFLHETSRLLHGRIKESKNLPVNITYKVSRCTFYHW